MGNYCVMCSSTEELPEGTHLCHRCQKGESGGGIECPECSALLTPLHSSWSFTNNGLLYSTLFHCPVCSCDYENAVEYIRQPAVLRRKIWG